MYKITSTMLQDINKLFDRSTKAINTLQRAGNNKIIYPELQKDLQNMIDKLNNQYALDEFEDPDARDRKLNRIKREADKDWEGRKVG